MTVATEATILSTQFQEICAELKLPTNPEAIGLEISIGGYYWPGVRGFTWPFYWVMHDRGLVNAGQGPPVKGASCFRMIRTHRPMLAERFLLPLRGLLGAIGHTGPVEVACRVDDRGDAYAVEIDATPYSAALMQIMVSDRWDLAEGADFSLYDFLAQIRLWRLDKPGEEGMVVGHGKTAKKAFKDAEKNAAALGIQNLCYRTDGGIRVRDDLAFVERSGWLR